MYTKIEDFNFPASFAKIQEQCDPRLKLDLVAPSQCQELIGTINAPIRVHLDPAFILQMALNNEELFHALIGKEGRMNRSSSTLVRLDIEQGKAKTMSGNIYGFDQIITEDSEIMLDHLCVLFNQWGLSEYTKTPPLFY